MEPDYFITEDGLPNILRRERRDRRLTDVKKFQHKRNVVEIDAAPPINAKSLKNLQNERLKQGMEEQRGREMLERMRDHTKTRQKLLRPRLEDIEPPITVNYLVEPS